MATRKERHDEVVSLANNLGLSVRSAGTNEWHIDGHGGYCGMLVYNQRSGVWKAMGGHLSKAHFGALGGLLNLMVCEGVHASK